MRWGMMMAGLLLTAAATAEVTLEPVDFTAWDQTMAGYEGDIVVVDLWATWCQPCIERFPKMVKLHEKYAEKGVRFVSMLLEDPNEPGVAAMAEAFLERQNATFDNFMMDENLGASFDHFDISTLPAVLVYDRSGERSHKLTADDPNNQFDEQDVEAAIEGLLAEG